MAFSIQPTRLASCLAAILLFATPSWAEGSRQQTQSKAPIAKGTKTGVTAVKGGVKTGVEGMRTFGRSVRGFFRGGSDEARREWQAGKTKVKQAARETKEKTKAAAR